MNATATDWIKPGAPIAVYRNNAIHGDDGLTLTTVDKVTKKSFTVTGLPSERFQLDSMKAARSNLTNFVAVAPEDPKVAEVQAVDRRSQALSAAHAAVEDWNMGSRRLDRDRIDNAIKTLTALRDAL